MGKIESSRSNPRYKEIKVQNLPKYLDNEAGTDIDIVAKIRCGNFDQRHKYWYVEKDGLCILCSKELGDTEHLWNRCEIVKRWNLNRKSKELKCKEIAEEEGNKNIIKIFKKIDKEIKKKVIKDK